MELALAAGDEERAFASFRSLCVLPREPAELALAARRRLVWAGHGARVQREMDDLCGDPAVHRAIAATWARTSLLRDDGSLDARLDTLAPTAPGARGAGLAVLGFHGSKRERFRLVRWLIRRRKWLLGHLDLWPNAAAALVACDLPRLGAIWLAGCPLDETDAAAAWWGIARTLRASGKPNRAIAASRRADLTREQGPVGSYHRVWLAFDAALAAHDERAHELLAGVQEPHLDPPEKIVLELTTRMLHLRTLPAARRPGALAQDVVEIDGLCHQLAQARGCASYVRRARYRIARDVGTLTAWSWAFSPGFSLLWGLGLAIGLTAAVSPGGRWWLFGAVVLAWLLPRVWERSWPPSFEPSPARVRVPEKASRDAQETP